MKRLRPPVLSGTWYPGDPHLLTKTVRKYLEGADPASRPVGRPVLAVVPHAGYAYSGPTAGRLYGLLAGESYDQVFILAPSHRTRLSRIALPRAEAFATPSGEVPVATDTVAALAAAPDYAVDNNAHAAEHAIEIQLPFLQHVFGSRLRIVPLLVPSLTPEQRQAAATALAPWCDGRSLFVVSTDFTHYGAAYGYLPFQERIPEQLHQLDQGAIDRILAHDPEGLLQHRERTGITMCGIDAAALALTAPLARGGDDMLIDYSRSGDRDGDYSLSVSYASILLYQPAGGMEGEANVEEDVEAAGSLTADERRLLLILARRVVEAAAANEKPPTPEQVAQDLGCVLTPVLQESRGAFVTLTLAGKLRGCIGYIEGIKPLGEAVADNAFAAARRDPRFPPVAYDEVAAICLEVSALTPLRTVSGPAEIVAGRHGIVLQKGPAKSVFLPQVATEQGWDLETTLSQLALKAGLPPDGWREGAEFQVFEAEVFAEEIE